ncbi:CARDB domain-containing protein [Dongia rigui]|uniref:CARDB domain-containing protein n=1 Tax=Dongia rigui TaxID=940149 RepID=A0ABU5DY26_9PROT|nr:CARDB domain-containing protein [Dongia rigui]MDY0871820.1 CARDB domain-containing protein [Dongia rigui]
MLKYRLLARTATTALFFFTAGAAALADIYTPTSESLSDPKIGPALDEQAAALGTQNGIIVVPDKNDYAFAKPGSLNLPFHLRTEVSKDKWRIKESYIVIGIAPIESGGQTGSCCGALNEFDPANFASPVAHAPKKKIDMDGWWTAAVGNNSLGTRARNACRNLRQDLAQQGLSHDEIFGQDRQTILPTSFRYVARVGHKNDTHDVTEMGTASREWKQSQETWYNIAVICQHEATRDVAGDPTRVPTGSDDIALGFQVSQAALAITPKAYEASCPAKLHLNPTIEATGKGVVRYRFVNELGHHSQEFQVNFTKPEVKFLDHVISIDAQGKPTDLGFKAPKAQGGAFGLVAPTDPNLKQGYFQLEVLSPHKKLSNIADYSVKCVAETVGDLAPKPDLADLVVEDVQPAGNLLSKVFVKVTNVGTGPSTPTNLKATSLKNGQTIIRGTLVPAVEPGQSQVVMAQLGTTISSAEQIAIQVDSPNRIKEADESNNGFQFK